MADVTIYDSPENMIETIIALYRDEAIKLDENGFLETDFDLEEKISSAINVKSEYWKL